MNATRKSPKAIAWSIIGLLACSVTSTAHAAEAGEPVGACCHEYWGNGMICEMLTDHVCGDYLGYWYGPNVSCSDQQVECDMPGNIEGACCYTDHDLGFICAMLIEEHCIDLNGYWYGPGVLCTDPQVECDLPGGDPGACCYTNDDQVFICIQATELVCHGLPNGYWYGAGVPCTAPQVECDLPGNIEGACCYTDDDLGFICAMLIEEHCIDLNGYWYGPGVLCTDPQVECDLPGGDKGACCYSDADGTLVCIEVNAADCETLNGTWYGVAVLCTDPIVDCDDTSDEPGACCYDDPALGWICTMVTYYQCIDLPGNYWYGAGVPCTASQVECDLPGGDKGACCYSEDDGTLVCIEVNAADCESLNGMWYGIGILCTDPIVDCDGSSDDPGACCYDDQALGWICTMVTESECLELPGSYWYGAGVPCTAPQVECDLPGGDCVIEPGANCAGRPAYQDPDFSQVFGNGQIAVQTASPSIFGGSVVTVFDLSNINAAPLNSWFSLNRYSDPDWNQSKLGSVFGLAVDGDGDIFVTSTRSWYTDYPGIGGWGAVYRLDRVTGDVSVFATLPNTNSGLGSITWDCDHNVFFVTNMEDGLIYRLDTNGNTLGTFDPAQPWNGSVGPVSLGDRPWAVEVHAGRLYFSMWNENAGQAIAGVANEIWSVALDASGMPVGAAVLEVTMPGYSNTNWSSPVADIRFSPRGTMLLAERTMVSFEQLAAHDARVLEYECQSGYWVPSGNTFSVGEYGGANGSGGVDADLERTWASGDALHLNHAAPYSNIYGIQGMPATGGTIADSVLIDYQDNLIGQDKTMLGDLVVTAASTEPCFTTYFFDVTCRPHHIYGSYHYLEYGFANNGPGNIDQVQVTGPSGVTITPNFFNGPFPPYQSYTLDSKLFGAPHGQTVCITITVTFDDGSSCSEELCFETPACPGPIPGDLDYDFVVDITDLLGVIERWGEQCGDDDDCMADQDGDGTVGIGDLLVVLENWS
ncbi:MAG: hypothetical protein VX527_05430 [Planctomycetota bacterium]|nr:hypothetical protein [Planctomycetota bacterium]